MTDATPPLVAYWDGPVSWVERLCAASMLGAGHALTVYSHDPDALAAAELAPDIRDAREIIPESHAAHRYREARRFTMFSNLFRLELQRQGRGVWVDLDCLMLRPLAPESDYVFGLMSPVKVNGAVLRLPAEAPMVEDYMAAITAVPLRIPWASPRRRLWRELEILAGRPVPHASQRTNLGPRALTYFLGKHGLLHHAAPRAAFYPVANEDTGLLTAPDDRPVREKLAEDTVLVHLWRGKLKRTGALDRLPPRSSYLGQACETYGISARGPS